MLAKKFRLSIQSQIFRKSNSTVQKRGNKYFIIKTTPNNFPFSRFGVVVSRKVGKKAAQRNRIKRTIFNFIQQRGLHQNPSRDILLITLPTINQLTKTEIEKELNNLIT